MEIRVHELTVCEKPEPCCGVTYILLSSIGGDGSREAGSAYWTAFDEIRQFEELGD
ncbi:MAG TPA: hypothetical protein VFN26_04985 [Candidatus Acidoferrum sp.]|nr:hypothetical protein [Candidatus Acidoferrum sp.]